MAQLGEVLSGLLTDVVRARMAADAATAQAVEAYRADPALASMSVPRVTVSNVTVKLNFAVAGVTIPTRQPVPAEQASAQWSSVIRARVGPMMPRYPGPAPTPEPSPFPSPKPAPSARALPPDVELPDRVPVEFDVAPELIQGIVEGRIEPVVTATVDGIVQGSQAPISAELRERIASTVRREALVYADILRQRELANQALDSQLEVDIVADTVAGASPEALQSLEVTFSIDDIEDIVSSTTGWR